MWAVRTVRPTNGLECHPRGLIVVIASVGKFDREGHGYLLVIGDRTSAPFSQVHNCPRRALANTRAATGALLSGVAAANSMITASVNPAFRDDDSLSDGACLWCGHPFRARRGGSPQRFCRARCRTAFWSALHRWGKRAIAAGALTVIDLRNGATAACTLQGEPVFRSTPEAIPPL